MAKLSQTHKIILAIFIGVLLGILWLAAVRFFTYKSTTVHYHANFALYVNGVKDEFKSFTFYEEVQSCGSDEVNNPKTRTHMHDQVNNTVHVHANAVTWSQFFTNLQYTLGNEVLETDNGVFVNSQDGNKLTFILNGEKVDSIADRVIKSEDRLLINYGKDDSITLQKRYDDVAQSAGEANKKNDPSSCKGTKPLTVGERLKQAFGF